LKIYTFKKSDQKSHSISQAVSIIDRHMVKKG